MDFDYDEEIEAMENRESGEMRLPISSQKSSMNTFVNI